MTLVCEAAVDRNRREWKPRREQHFLCDLDATFHLGRLPDRLSKSSGEMADRQSTLFGKFPQRYLLTDTAVHQLLASSLLPGRQTPTRHPDGGPHPPIGVGEVHVQCENDVIEKQSPRILRIVERRKKGGSEASDGVFPRDLRGSALSGDESYTVVRGQPVSSG
jgi:hypothetical protein